MDLEGGYPTAIDVLVVTAADLVTAYEADLTTDRDVGLRVTPPFSGRMRARLHQAGSPQRCDEDGSPASGDPAPLHVAPETLLDDPPAYPRPDETGDRLRADSSVEYSLDRHRRRHRRAIEAWRAAVPAIASDRADLETPAGRTTVDVRVLDADWPPDETG